MYFIRLRVLWFAIGLGLEWRASHDGDIEVLPQLMFDFFNKKPADLGALVELTYDFE